MTLNLGNIIVWLLFIACFIGGIIATLDWARAGYLIMMAGLGLYLGSIIGSTDE